MGISLGEVPGLYFGHVGIFSEEIPNFGIEFSLYFAETATDLVRLIAFEFSEYEIEFREIDYDHMLCEIGKEMENVKRNHQS